MPGEITTWNYAPIFMSDTLDECESFVSYFDTRFVRFLILCGLCSQSTGSPELYRFVPDPGPFDHIFTDEELYTKYNLSDDQIKVIESVIKSR